MFMLHFFGVFIFCVACDLLAILDLYLTTHNKAGWGASIATLISGMVIFIFVDIYTNRWLAIPYLLGTWIGSYLGIRLKKHLEKKWALQ